jgi:hypothetical protein
MLRETGFVTEAPRAFQKPNHVPEDECPLSTPTGH